MRSLIIIYIILVILLLIGLIRWRHKLAFFEAAGSIIVTVILGVFLYLSIDESSENKHVQWLNAAPLQVRLNSKTPEQLQKFQQARMRELLVRHGLADQASSITALDSLIALAKTPGTIGMQASRGLISQAMLEPWQDFLSAENLTKTSWQSDDSAVQKLRTLVKQEKPGSLLESFIAASLFERLQGKSEVLIREQASDRYRQRIELILKVKKDFQDSYIRWLRNETSKQADATIILDIYICNLRDQPLTKLSLGVSGYSQKRSTAHDLITERSSFPNFTNLETQLELTGQNCKTVSWQDNYAIYDRYGIRYYEAAWQDGKKIKVESY